MNKSRGIFITFEGGECSGKTTLIENLKLYLSEQNIPFLVTREPGGTKISERIRNLLFDKELSEMHPRTEMFLFNAARCQHVHEVILPAIEEGKVVLCDRFLDSSLVYQGYAGKESIEQVLLTSLIATFGLVPDRTYLLDISIEQMKQRMESRGVEKDRIELKNVDFHQTVREGFLEIAKVFQRIQVVDAAGSEKEIFEIIKKDFKELLRNKGENDYSIDFIN